MGFQYGIPDDEEPNTDWEEINLDDMVFLPDPNYIVPYQAVRQNSYPTIGEQFDLIFHDIDNGVFGESAKNSSFFKAIKEIKNKIPKNT